MLGIYLMSLARVLLTGAGMIGRGWAEPERETIEANS
jgi:hypothetical protein